MNNCFDFSRGVNHCIDEVKEYIEKNKRVVIVDSKPVEVIDVKDFKKWLDKM